MAILYYLSQGNFYTMSIVVMCMRGFMIFLLVCCSLSTEAQDWSADDIEVFDKFDDFEHLLHIANDTTYVINFWATWCGPCVKELPYFEVLNDTYKDQKFKLILVSLDMVKKIDSKLVPFLNKNKIKSEVVLLADGKANRWIDKVDPNWSGAIPITIVYRADRNQFYEKEFHATEELVEIIEPFLDK